MKTFINLLLIFLFITSCSFNKVIKKHGVRNLEKKQDKLILFTSNSNDIIQVLGPPSTKSTFDNDLWIYIERRNSKSNILNLGKKNTVRNNVLVLEIDTK